MAGPVTSREERLAVWPIFAPKFVPALVTRERSESPSIVEAASKVIVSAVKVCGVGVVVRVTAPLKL